MVYTHTHTYVEEVLTLTCTVAQSATKDQSDGSVLLTIAGGSDPYAISWSGPQDGGIISSAAGDITISNLPAGNYLFNVNSSGENATCNIVIPEKQTIDAGDCISLGDDLPSTSPEGDTYCYKWSPTTYFDSGSSETDKVITTCPTNNITYTVTVTDGLNITETREYEICVEGGGGGDDCDFSISCLEFQAASSGQENGIAIVNIDGLEDVEYEVAWSGASSASLFSDEEQVFISNLSEGTYTITVTNIDTDCSETCTVTIDNQEDCEVIAVDDVFVLDLDGNKASVKLTINVKDDLLANDKYPPNSTFELECTNQANLTLSCAGSNIGCGDCGSENFIVEAFALGVYEFEYLIKGCDGASLDRAKVKIVVSGCHENEPENGCNIINNGDFDCFDNNTDFRRYVNGSTNINFQMGGEFRGLRRLEVGEEIEPWNNELTTCCGDEINATLPSSFGEDAAGVFSNCVGSDDNPNAFEFRSNPIVIALDPPIRPGESVDVSMVVEISTACANYNARASIGFLTSDFDDTGQGNVDIFDLPSNEWTGEVTSVDASDDLANGNDVTPQIPASITNNSARTWNYIVIYPNIDCSTLVQECSQDDDNSRQAFFIIDDIVVNKESSGLELSVETTTSMPCPEAPVVKTFEICVPAGSPSTGDLEISIDTDGYTLLRDLDFKNGNSFTLEGGIESGSCYTVQAIVFTPENPEPMAEIVLRVEGECLEPVEIVCPLTPFTENPPLGLTKDINCDPATGVFTVSITVENLTDFASIQDVEIVDQLPEDFTVVDAGDFSVNGTRLRNTTPLTLTNTATFSYTMTADIFCESGFVPCAIAYPIGSNCMEAVACFQGMLEDCRVPEDVTADFTYSQLDCVATQGDLIIQFNSDPSVQGSEYMHEWDFGNGDTSTEPNPTYDGYAPGSYEVTHTVTIGCQVVKKTMPIKIGDCDFLCDVFVGDDCGNDVFKIKGSGKISDIATGVLPTEGDPNASCYQIRGRITIDEDYILMNKTVIMEPGSELFVNPDIKFGVQNSVLKSCRMWNGIVVAPPNNNMDGGFLDISNSTIMDAFDAVSLSRGSDLASINTTYDRNQNGITITGTPNLSGFEDNTFSCSSALNNGNWGYAGIVSSSANFSIGQPNGARETINTFKDTDFGITYIQGNISIADCSFERLRTTTEVDYDLPLGVSSTGIGIYGYLATASVLEENQFLELYTGIYNSICSMRATQNAMSIVQNGIINESPIVIYRINENEIACSEVGIKCIGGGFFVASNEIFSNILNLQAGSAACEGIVIESNPVGLGLNINAFNEINIPNTATTEFTGIRLTSSRNVNVQNTLIDISAINEGRVRGVFVDNTDESKIQVNYFRTDIPNAFNSESSYGVLARSSEEILYCSNLFKSISFGNDGLPYNSRFFHDFSFFGICDRTQIQGNFLGNATVGLHLARGSRIDVQRNYVNNWIGEEYEEWHARYDGTRTEAERSKFFVSTLPSDPNGAFDFFPENLFEVDGVIDIGCGSLIANINLTDSDQAAARGVSEEEVFNWEAARSLIRRLRLYPNLLGENSVVDSFYLANSSSNIDALFQVESILQQNNEILDTTQAAALQDDITTLQEWLVDLSELATDYQNATTTGAKNNIQNDIIALNEDIEILAEQVSSTMNDLQQNAQYNLHYAYQVNQAILPENTFASNEQFVNRIALNAEILTNYKVDSTDADELLAVASQCPLESGSVVLRARQLYTRLVEEVFFDDNNCE